MRPISIPLPPFPVTFHPVPYDLMGAQTLPWGRPQLLSTYNLTKLNHEENKNNLNISIMSKMV